MINEMIQKNPILRLPIDFSLAVVEYCELLQGGKKFVIAQ
jgi:hypothetical protein